MTDEACLTSVGFLSLDIPGEAATKVWCGNLGLRVITDPGRPGRAEVPLPGWIWNVSRPQEPAWIRWNDRGFPVPRRRVHDRLRELAARPVEAWEAPALVGALDHVHHGALLNVPLGNEISAWLRQAAWATGLGSLVTEPFVPHPPQPGQAAIAAFGAAVHRPDNALIDGPSLDAALAQALPLARDLAAREALILAVTPEFCRIDRMQQLVAILAGFGVENPWKHTSEAWARAQALAFALVEGDATRSHHLAQQIASNPADWVATPVLAWALRHPFTPAGRHLPGTLRHALVDCLTRLAEARAPLACAEVIRGTLGLFDEGLSWLASDLAETVTWRALRAFGTSPLFWNGIAALAEKGRPIRAELLAGNQAFRMLVQGIESSDAARRHMLLSTGLRRLRNLGVADIERLRTELLMGEGLDGDALGQAFGDGKNGALELLRAALAPQANREPSVPDRVLVKALRWAERDVPDVPLADVQRRAMGLARTLAAPDATDALPKTEHPGGIEALMPLLAQLAGAEARHCGIGIACALLADLATDGSIKATMALSRVASEVLSLLQALPASPSTMDHPFPRSAAARLVACVPAAPHLSAVVNALPSLPSGAAEISLRRPEGLSLGPALIDTLVVVVSCRTFLDTRVAALRQGWLADLARMNVPHVILVGGEQTRLSGDILEVAAPDTYEGLPEKIVAMIDWVMAETGFAHVLKIDDDCHVDPVAWFGDALWRQADWYGRRLDKTGPLAQRDWHQARAQSDVARLSFETLPIEGIYTDGSTGYALSRKAMAAVVSEAGRIEGRRMIAGAFSEDRLIGAFLTRAGFAPRSDNYHSLILRKTHRDGLAVPRWAEGIMASDPLHHTKVVHFDGVVPLDRIEAARRSGRLSPARIWPASRLPGTGHDNGGFCLVSSQTQLTPARLAPVAVVSVMRNERVILPHFLEHYRQIGVEGFLIVDNLSDDGTLEYLAEQPDVAVFSAASQFRTSDQGTDWKLALMGQVRLGRWSLVADADEFLLLPRETSLPEHVDRLPAGVDAQRVLMQDMYPRGAFAQADFSSVPPFEAAPLSDPEPFLRNSIWRGPFSNGETLTSALRHRLMPGSRVDAFVAQKTALVRYLPWMRFSTSLHYATEVTRASDDLIFAHFKYNARFATKALAEAKRGQYWNSAEEYRTYCATGFANPSADPIHQVAGSKHP